VDVVDHINLAGDTGRDERHRRDARGGDGEVSGGVGEGEAKRITPAWVPLEQAGAASMLARGYLRGKISHPRTRTTTAVL
jgi:hypothetical protein